MEKPYQEDDWDKRNQHKKTPEEIKEWLKKLPCAYCNKIEPCGCEHKKKGLDKKQRN